MLCMGVQDHITAKFGLSELSSTYNIIDKDTKVNIVILNKGELVMIHILHLGILLKLHFQRLHLREVDKVKPWYLIDV